MTSRKTDRVRWAEPGDLAAVADRIAAELARPGPKRLCVPGGSTAPRVFALLATRKLDWSGVTLMLNDDRRVPDDHPASNHGALVRALGDTGVTIERLVEGAKVEPFDLVWLGMGEDGHIASLFPHMIAEVRPGPSVIATTPIPLPPEAPFDRLTLNRKALCATRAIIIVVTGTAKKLVLERAIAGSDAFPVSDIVRGNKPPVTIYWSE
ncbi:6-phosphogluconolactonase [Novosphingobium lentum]|uniref:6-phosphogluconolactonase n=1 Tax=Novosphingobium lentum TaxID=145287 RepID=UPI00082DC2B6|nr:6-phosphogluconolactonase [Novosphingobium lentum]